jgi:hypothetical protein
MSLTIHLITESKKDESDVQVVRALIKKRGLDIKIQPVEVSGGSGGISRLAEQLETLIKIALLKRKPGDCVAVLHDTDEQTQSARTAYNRIKAICKKYQADVTRVVARQAVESWLLADAGLCQWLETKPKPHDKTPKPKDVLNSLLQRKRMKWQGPDRGKVLDHVDGSGDQCSPSMKRAVAHLEESSCK